MARGYSKEKGVEGGYAFFRTKHIIKLNFLQLWKKKMLPYNQPAYMADHHGAAKIGRTLREGKCPAPPFLHLHMALSKWL